jgi:hypothetical protein
VEGGHTHLERELAVVGGAGWIEEDVEGGGEQKNGAACAAALRFLHAQHTALRQLTHG